MKLSGITAQQALKVFDKLKSKRTNWESNWQELYDYIVPRKNDVVNMSAPGQKKYTNLLDSTAMVSAELLAGTLHGMLTNPVGFFFGLTTGDTQLDQDDTVRQYLQLVVREIHSVFNRSNFQTEVHELYLDLVGIGNACMYVEEDDDYIARFSTRAIREVYAEENSKGIIDTIYRSFPMTPRDLVDEFGLESLPKKIQDLYNKDSEKEFTVLHVVMPRKKAKIAAKEMPFAYISQYFLTEEKEQISIKGYNEFPYMFPRWTKVSGETYGRGCGEKALPAAKSANVMRETLIRGAQKVVDPPLQAPDDGFTLPINTKPGGLTYYRPGTQDKISPIFNDTRIDIGYQTIDQERSQIREAFYTDQLKLREGPQMTATEVSERVDQALRFLGPMLGRQQAEFLQPLVARVYSILERRGLLPQAPAQLIGKELKIQYSSVMAMQQRMSELQNIQRTLTNITPFASSDPSVLDNLNGDAAVKYIAKLCNLPQELIRNNEDVKQMRQNRAQMQAQQQAMMQQEQQAKTASLIVGATAKNKKAA